MSFLKVSEALAILKNTEQCSDDVKKILQQLIAKTIQPADACFQIFELSIGSETHATYAVCYFAILQNGWTTITEIVEQMKLLTKLHYEMTVKDKPDREIDEVSARDVAERIHQLIDRGFLRLGEEKLIFLPM